MANLYWHAWIWNRSLPHGSNGKMQKIKNSHFHPYCLAFRFLKFLDMPIFDQISGFSKRKFFFTGQLRCCTSTKRTLERTDCTILCYATTERTICYPSPQLHSHCILPLRTSLFFTCTTILLRYNQLVSFLSRTYVPNLCDTTCEVKVISSSTE